MSRKNNADVLYLLTAINLMIYFLCVYLSQNLTISMEILSKLGGDVPDLTTNGQWWRIISASFLHANLTHIASNTIAIIYIAPLLGQKFSKASILFIYTFSVLLGGALSLLFFSGYTVSVGASGGIFGLYGAFLVYVIYRKKYKSLDHRILMNVVQLVFFNLGFGVAGINAWAHLGGLIGGSITSALIFFLGKFTNKLERVQILSASLVGLSLIVIYSLPKIQTNFTVKFQQEYVNIGMSFAGLKSLMQNPNDILQIQSEISQNILPNFVRIKTRLKALNVSDEEDIILRDLLLQLTSTFEKNQQSLLLHYKYIPIDSIKAQKYLSNAHYYNKIAAEQIRIVELSLQRRSKTTNFQRVPSSE